MQGLGLGVQGLKGLASRGVVLDFRVLGLGLMQQLAKHLSFSGPPLVPQRYPEAQTYLILVVLVPENPEPETLNPHKQIICKLEGGQ